MKNLTEVQAFRSSVLEHANYDLDLAKEHLEFIMGDPQEIDSCLLTGETISCESLQEVAIDQSCARSLPNGTYLITSSGKTIAYYGGEVDPTISYSGVGIIDGNKSLIVSLCDVADGEVTTLTTESCGSRFIEDYHKATQDWSGAENTADMLKILNPQITLADNEFIPSLGQMYFILLHFKQYNQALVACGGEKIQCCWYWTSTEYSSASAWYLHLSYGYAYNNTKATYQTLVRPVSAFLK